MTTDWVERARAVAGLTQGAEAALDALDAELPRAWRETAISALLCTPRTPEVQRALEATNRWKRWRAVLPHDLACTFLTLCHPSEVPLRCSGCDRGFTSLLGVVTPIAQWCNGCLSLRRARPQVRCLGCGGKAVAGYGFCKACEVQLIALSKARPHAPPPLPRGLHEMVKRRLPR